jgi:hypothetical protein
MYNTGQQFSFFLFFFGVLVPIERKKKKGANEQNGRTHKPTSQLFAYTFIRSSLLYFSNDPKEEQEK